MLFTKLQLIFASAFMTKMAFGVPIDNGLVGEPFVECGADAITIYFQTRNVFHGHVFAKGFYNDVNCRADYSPIADSRISIRIPIGACGVRRLRSVNPPGLYQSITAVITFHPLFVTKVDRAFNLNCFYMEAEKLVTNALDVSMLPTETREIAVSMPPCRYEVLNYETSTYDSKYLTPVRYARVGQPVLHKWQCNTDAIGLFCMTVHSCTVDDGLGRSVRILDENGCALDKYILGNLQYASDTMAQRESHVFKYADKAQVYFQCQITLSLKNTPDQPCPRPVCPEPTRGKRAFTSASDNLINDPNVISSRNIGDKKLIDNQKAIDEKTIDHLKSATTDVSNTFTVLEIDDNADKQISNLRQLPFSSKTDQLLCLNAAAAGLSITAFGIVITAAVITSFLCIAARKRRQFDCRNAKNEDQ